MRTGICDMVAIAKLLNMTLVLPELDHTSFWADPSDFGDIFDTGHFIASLRSSVQIVHELPRTVLQNIQEGSLAVYYMHPGSWSNESYYLNQVWMSFKRKIRVKYGSYLFTLWANSALDYDGLFSQLSQVFFSPFSTAADVHHSASVTML
jgi:hypothetical protein